MDGQGEEGNLRSALVRLAGGLIIEEGLDGEVTDALGRTPHAFGERAVLKLMYAALIRAAERWRGLRMTEFERRQLAAIRSEFNRAHAERTAPVVSANVTASPTRLSSKTRT
jgi:hypothetical protein